jgi:hypothetical protein
MEILLCNLSKNSIKLLSRKMSRGRSFCREKKRRMRESEEGSFPFIEPNERIGSNWAKTDPMAEGHAWAAS